SGRSPLPISSVIVNYNTTYHVKRISQFVAAAMYVIGNRQLKEEVSAREEGTPGMIDWTGGWLSLRELNRFLPRRGRLGLRGRARRQVLRTSLSWAAKRATERTTRPNS